MHLTRPNAFGAIRRLHHTIVYIAHLSPLTLQQGEIFLKNKAIALLALVSPFVSDGHTTARNGIVFSITTNSGS